MGTPLETLGVNLLKLRETLASGFTKDDGNPERSRILKYGTCRDLTGSTYRLRSTVKRKSRPQTIIVIGDENHSGMKRRVGRSNRLGGANFGSYNQVA